MAIATVLIASTVITATGFAAGQSWQLISSFIFLIWVVGGMLAFFIWWVNRQGLQPKRQTAINSGNILFGFGSALLLIFHGAYNWTRLDDEDVVLFSPFIFILVIVIIIFFNQRKYRGWNVIKYGIQDLRPQDERDESIVSAASQVTFIITVLLLLALAAVVQLAPTPAKAALVETLVGVSLLATGIREIVAWRMGLRQGSLQKFIYSDKTNGCSFSHLSRRDNFNGNYRSRLVK